MYIGEWSAGVQDGVGTYLYTDGRAEVGEYALHRDKGLGVRWSSDRQQAWRLQDGEATGEILLAEARLLAERVGLPMPDIGLKAG
jgi:hypothetical protein